MSTPALPHISICVCTYRRPKYLEKLLRSVSVLRTDGGFSHSVVVCDNDHAGSAHSVVEQLSQELSLQILYVIEPVQNIARARNRALEAAKGDYIAWIDDDEFPDRDWLVEGLKLLQARGVTGVLGPVKPHFESPAPAWLVRGRFCERPAPPTGTILHWSATRTGNVIMRAFRFDGGQDAFRLEFANGGEDVDFFMRAVAQGCVFLWCNEAIVHEAVPTSRMTRSYLLRRALVRGQTNVGEWIGLRALAKTLIAIPLYLLLLPFSLLAGHHHTVSLAVRMCDHLGRLFAVMGIRIIGRNALGN